MGCRIGFKYIAESLVKFRISQLKAKGILNLCPEMVPMDMTPLKGMIQRAAKTVGLERLDCGFAIGFGAKLSQLAGGFFMRKPRHNIAEIEDECFHRGFQKTEFGILVGPKGERGIASRGLALDQ